MTEFAGIPVPPPRYAKSFRKVGRTLLFIAAFATPFLLLPITSDPVGINKFFIIGLLTAGAFACFLGCALEERRINYPHSLLALFLSLFLIADGVSVWLSVAPSQSLFGNLMAADSFVAVVIYVLLFFLFFFFFHREDVVKVEWAIGAGLLVATAMQFWVNPVGSYASWGSLLVALIAGLTVVRPGELSSGKKIYFFSTFLVAFVALIFIDSQALWLALAVFVAVVAMLRFGPREHFQYAFVIITLALFFSLIGARLPVSRLISRDTSPGISPSLAAVQGVFKGGQILTGSGPATFAFDFEAYRPVSFNSTPYWSDVFPQGHDFAVTLLATVGIVGFLLFLLFAFFAIQPFLQIHHFDIDLAMAATAATFLVVALFLYPASFAELALLFMLLGLLHGATSRRTLAFDMDLPWKSFSFSLATMVCAAALLAGVFVLGEKYVAAIFSAQSNSLVAAGNMSEAFQKINSAIWLDPSDIYYREASGVLVAEAKNLAASTDPAATAELSGVITSSVQAAENAVADNSHDPANWENLGATYEAIMPLVAGADVSAENDYQQAATLDPSNPQWDVDTARVFMESASLLAAGSSTDSVRTTDWTNAESFLDKAIALKDDDADPRVMLVDLYLQEGNIAQAIQKVQELAQQNPLDPGVAFELGYLYYQSNQIDRAKQEFQVATILSPDYENAYYFLGLVYDQEGMISQALAAFEKVDALDPGNAQVAQAIANLQAGRPALADVVASSTLPGE